MDSQLVDLGGLLAVVGILWRIIVSTKNDLNRRLDRQDEALKESHTSLKADVAGLKDGQAELAKDFAGLKADVAGLKDGQAELKVDMREGQVRMEGHIIQLAGGLGEVRGELRRIVPREKVSTGGS